MVVVRDKGKSTVVNTPKDIEAAPSIKNFIVALRPKGRKNAIAPSAKSGSIVVIRVADSPSTTMIR
jgi:hypothetical protein